MTATLFEVITKSSLQEIHMPQEVLGSFLENDHKDNTCKIKLCNL